MGLRKDPVALAESTERIFQGARRVQIETTRCILHTIY